MHRSDVECDCELFQCVLSEAFKEALQLPQLFFWHASHSLSLSHAHTTSAQGRCHLQLFPPPNWKNAPYTSGAEIGQPAAFFFWRLPITQRNLSNQDFGLSAIMTP